MRSEAERILYSLPQASHLADSRISKYLNRIEELGEDPVWHSKRMAGFGGSEAGSILREAFGVFHDTPGESFNSAEDIIGQKLLRTLPKRSTIQARRGSDIERLTRAVFHKKYRVKSWEKGFSVTEQHASIKCMLGNIDDCCEVSDKKILIDYKSSQEPYTELPFDYSVQLNHYGANARSNGVRFDKGMIVGIHAPESVLRFLADVAKNADNNPADFDFWVNTIATKGLPGLQLKTYPVTLNDKFMDVIEGTLNQHWKEYVLAGRLMVKSRKQKVSAEIDRQVDSLMSKSSEYLAIKSSLEEKINTQNEQLNRLLIGIDHKTISSANNHLINIGSRTTLDCDSAIDTLKLEDVDLETLYETTDKVNSEYLLKAYEKLGGDVNDPSIYEKKASTKAIRAKLIEKGLEPEMFEKIKYSFTETRQKLKKEKFREKVEFVDSFIESYVVEQEIHSPSRDEETKSESPMMM